MTDTIFGHGCELVFADDTHDGWNQFGKTGEFLHWSGKKLQLGPDVYERMERNFLQMGGRLPINLLHSELRERMAGKPLPATEHRAVGWIVALRWDAEKIEFQAEWTDEGKELVRSGAFRFFSPEIHPDYQTETGQKVGITPVGGALVNRPFLKGMRPLAATDTPASGGEETTTMSKLTDEIRSVLGVESEDETVLLSAVKEAATLAADAKNDQADTDKTVAHLTQERDDAAQENTDLSKRLIALEAKDAARTAEDIYSDALDAGKVVPAQKADILRMAVRDPEGARDFLKNAEPVLSFEATGSDNYKLRDAPGQGGNSRDVTVNASVELDKRALKLQGENKDLGYDAACELALAADPKLAEAFTADTN